MERVVETAIALWGDRYLPPSVIADQARALQASGALDGVLLADQMCNFIPPQLWTTENTPIAAVLPDPDSHSDVFVMAAYVAAAAPGLSLTISTDSVRRAPAELVQTMLTLANITAGRATFHVGGGEAKQCLPYGHKRSQGMSRMEDLFQIFNALMDAAGTPIDFAGRRWTLTKAAIGGAMPHRPVVIGLGGGPTLIDHATSYADGLALACPPVYASPERFAQAREEILAQVKAKGRDPDQFKFHVWFPAMIAADEEELEQHLDNPLVKWLGAVFGRITPTDWEAVGLPNPWPDGWVYYEDLLPLDTPDDLVESVIGTMTREHLMQGWVSGTPAQVAAEINRYVEAGAEWVCPMDYAPLVLPVDQAPAALLRSIDTCRLIKQAWNTQPQGGERCPISA